VGDPASQRKNQFQVISAQPVAAFSRDLPRSRRSDSPLAGSRMLTSPPHWEVATLLRQLLWGAGWTTSTTSRVLMRRFPIRKRAAPAAWAALALFLPLGELVPPP
jgi:hypothetical protein